MVNERTFKCKPPLARLPGLVHERRMNFRSCLRLAALACLPLAGCAQFPALEGTIPPELEAAPFPDLVPIAPVLAKAKEGGVDPVATRAGLDDRVARLRARAARLRGPVLSRAERIRLERGLR